MGHIKCDKNGRQAHRKSLKEPPGAYEGFKGAARRIKEVKGPTGAVHY